MNTTPETDPAGQVIATLRAQEAELRRAGLRRLSLSGSVARGEAGADSDVDLLAEPDAALDLVGLIVIERRIAEARGRRVEILAEPIENPRARV